MIKTKRLGRYHNLPSNNSNNDEFSSQFSDLAHLYKDKKRLLSWDECLFGNKRMSLRKLLEDANKTTERATRFQNKMKSKQLAHANRAKSIPENATIRKEYGKEMCELKHGPYYYTYWKDPESKKLKKRYIGNHIPKDKGLGNDHGNENHML